MAAHGYTLFDTVIGRCGIAWSSLGIIAVQLPEEDERRTAARLLRRCPQARQAPPPPGVQHAIDGIAALLEGQPSDLSTVVLDTDGVPELDRRVYEVARAIAPGSTRSYGEIAARLGDRRRAREVGRALARNRFPIIVPCHRVLGVGGKLGGFSASGGIATKLRLLTIEGARTDDAPTLFDGDAAFGLAIKSRRRTSL